jgi:hypothetical protein
MRLQRRGGTSRGAPLSLSGAILPLLALLAFLPLNSLADPASDASSPFAPPPAHSDPEHEHEYGAAENPGRIASSSRRHPHALKEAPPARLHVRGRAGSPTESAFRIPRDAALPGASPPASHRTPLRL